MLENNSFPEKNTVSADTENMAANIAGSLPHLVYIWPMLAMRQLWESVCTDCDDTRYLPPDLCHRRLKEVLPSFSVIQELGNSPENRPIYKISLGNGPLRLLFWSQMHGNEPTATRALLDFFKFLKSPQGTDWFAPLHNKLTLSVIPMLNPDGAFRFTRRNAAGIDMNRDARSRSTIEMQLFFAHIVQFAPHWAFNLHDQRNIYNVNLSEKPASISLLAPSADISVSLTPNRFEVMQLAAALARMMQAVIPGGVGRYSDEFYPTATGDNLQAMGIQTLLIESGGCVGDPLRNTARMLNFGAYIRICEMLATNSHLSEPLSGYAQIPPNTEKMFDIKLCNIALASGVIADVGITSAETLREGRLQRVFTISDIGDLKDWNAYETRDFKGASTPGPIVLDAEWKLDS